MQLNENTKWCAGALLRGATPPRFNKESFLHNFRFFSTRNFTSYYPVFRC